MAFNLTVTACNITAESPSIYLKPYVLISTLQIDSGGTCTIHEITHLLTFFPP